MSKEIYISSTPHETRLAIVEKEELSEIYYERENEYTLAGSIYNGRVTRVLPGMQSAFVDVGLERDAFLYITDFMEEQGEDSAEFESSEGRRSGSERSGSERNGSDRSGSDRSGERPRGERSGGRRSGGDRERPERSREAVPRDLPRESFATTGETTILQSPDFDSPSEGVAEPVEQATEDGGEGSRRWRGRRGRRRGGRGGEESGAAPEAQVAVEGDEQLPSTDAPEEMESGSLERVFGQEETAGREEPRGERGRSGRDRGGERNRDRGGRGRDRDRSDSGGERERRPERPVESASETADGVQPMILPGESLSRYRKDGEEPGVAASASVAPKASVLPLVTRPSTEINISAGAWDGGFVLPGESLSRRRGAEDSATGGRTAAAATSVTDAAQDDLGEGGSRRGSDRRRDRDRQRGRSGRGEEATPQAAAEEVPSSFHSGAVLHETLSPMEAAQPGVSSEHEAEAVKLPMESALSPVGASDDVPGFVIEAYEARLTAEDAVADDVVYEPSTDAIQPDGPAPEVLAAVNAMHAGIALEPAHAGEEFHEETQEYEPGEEASASYRVDPAGPSEFRQSGIADDDVEAGNAEVQADYAGTEHQYTTIDNAGEMLSELPGEVTVPEAGEDPTNPIEHETAVLSERGSEAISEAPAAPGETGGVEPGEQAFAPGQGELEEEYLDEDDTEVLDVAASYGDDIEEETLEAGAEIGMQLGSLVRDRALDEITSADSSVLDEEDEDFDIDEEEMEEDELDGTEEVTASEISEVEEDEVLEGEEAAFEEESEKPAASTMGDFPEFTEERAPRELRRSGSEDRGGEVRRESRRPGDRDRGGRDRDRGSRDRRGMAGSRSGGRQSRHSMQTTDLPAISDLLKPGQEVLVQIAKEPIAKKGARITSHIALPGRFLVFMPTVNHVGVSRKIESDSERRRLKEILLSEKGEAAGGFIVRTAASGASEEELRSDLRFLLNLWSDIKQRSEGSKSPALIYHDLNLIERVLRDQVSENFSAIWCDTETEYERVLRFLQRFEPSLMRRVKLYTKDTPLFEQFGISEEINKALRSKVWLKSGGSIVINQTEALVAIDINTGKYVGKTARLEDTIVKTNLDAIPEIVRQIRLRDLGGIIVIDFIDMDDRKNRQKVLIALEEELKKDRAPSKVLQFNDFGLVAITRKRVKQSLERTLSTTCGICAGTGMTKSPVTVCNEIYIELRKMHKQLDKGDVMLRVNPEVVKQLKANNAKWLGEMEEIAGKTILVKSDPSLHPEQFDIH